MANVCLKYLMFFINSLIFLSGFCLLGVGAWVSADPEGFMQLIPGYPVIYTAANIILGLGLLLFVVGLLGCCGGFRENKCLILTYFTLILLIFVMELIGIFLVLFFKKQLKEETFLKKLKNYYKGDNSSDLPSKAWNHVMLAFFCCGVLGPADFANVDALQELPPAQRVPLICCKRSGKYQYEILNKEKCLLGDPNFRNNQGCYNIVKSHFKKYINLIVVVGASVLLVEFLGMFFSMFLLVKLWKRNGSFNLCQNSNTVT